VCENITPPVAGARGQESHYQSIRELQLKILLTGKNGQVGAELAALLPRLGEVVSFDRHELDLSNPDQIRRAIREVQPTAIVNAAAYTAVDRAETDEQQARVINVDAPALMAEEAKKIGAVLVHYSTDYVFDGSADHPYGENDAPNPISVYGQTKFAGEEAIRAVGIPHLIFRTAWVYGTRGRNFLLTILRLATEREELKIVSDQFGAPTWSREIAKGTLSALEQFSKQNRETSSRLAGTYHMTAAGKTTWCEFAEAILERGARISPNVAWFAAATGGRPLIARRITPIATQQYPTPARRPVYSVLSNSRLKQAFGIELPDWKAQLDSVFADSQARRHTSARRP
jgi:dTDP-4-dehydrorhamnose reductase